MDNKKAIEHLEDINTVARTRQMCRSIDGELEDGETQMYKDRFEAVAMAMAALEMNIPKEATTQGMSKDGYWIIKCPECETVMEGMRNVANYCCKCGQAIKWGD